MKLLSIAGSLGLLLFSACSPTAPAPLPTPAPTPNIEATVSAAVAATVTAALPPTPAPATITSGELQQADARAVFLTARYGVEPALVAKLTKATYDLAGQRNIPTIEQRSQLHAVVLDFAEHGGAGLRPLGIEGDPESVSRQLGFSSSAALRAMTTGEIVRARVLIAHIGLLKAVIGN